MNRHNNLIKYYVIAYQGNYQQLHVCCKVDLDMFLELIIYAYSCMLCLLMRLNAPVNLVPYLELLTEQHDAVSPHRTVKLKK